MESKILAGFGIGLVTGVIIGGVIALLYAPKSGKETREMLKSKAMETRERAIDVAEHVKDFATETADKVKDATSEASRKGQAAIHALKS
jgi:gas vesicle protein